MSWYKGLAIVMAACATALSSTIAQAAFIPNGSVILDDRTGLEWLKPFEARGFALNTLQPELQTGGQFAGYRVAQLAEVEDLIFNSVGYDPNATGLVNAPNVRDYVDTFEFLATNSITFFLGAVYADGSGLGVSTASYSLLQPSANFPFGDLVDSSVEFSVINPTNFLNYITQGDDEIGWFLVRDAQAVPVGDSSGVFFLVGLGGLVVIRKWRSVLARNSCVA